MCFSFLNKKCLRVEKNKIDVAYINYYVFFFFFLNNKNICASSVTSICISSVIIIDTLANSKVVNLQ